MSLVVSNLMWFYYMTNKKIALITGITGQDGSYLAEFLLSKNYEVHGIIRRSASINTERIDHIPWSINQNKRETLNLHYGDLTDSSSLTNIMNSIKPSEIYNLGAQSHVGISFSTPEYTSDVVGLGAVRLLEAIRTLGMINTTKYYQASSSELFGSVQEIPQTEKTPFYPRSPYAVAKLFAYWITINYREAYGLYACNGILFNHESPRRGESFVTRKITKALSRISLGLQDELVLGNLNAKRDWGDARDYVKMQWLILQQKTPQDFCISSGKQYSVRDFVNYCWNFLGKRIIWKGENENERGYDSKSGKLIVKVDKKYYRPSEVETLLGDNSKACKVLGWKPEIDLEGMIEDMMSYDLKEAKVEMLVKQSSVDQ